MSQATNETQDATPSTRYSRGYEKLREIDGNAGERVITALADIAPDFAIGPFFSRDVAGDTEQNIGGGVTATVPVLFSVP